MSIFNNKNKLFKLCRYAWIKSDDYYNKANILVEAGEIDATQHHIIRSIAANFESISESFSALLDIAVQKGKK